MQNESESTSGIVAGKPRESMAEAAGGAASDVPSIQVWPVQPAAAEASKVQPAVPEASKVPEIISAAPVLSIRPPVTVGLKRKAGDVSEGSHSPSSFEPSGNSKVCPLPPL